MEPDERLPMRIVGDRRLTAADLLIVAAVLTIVLALLLPTLRARSFHALLDRTAGEVEDVRRAALRYMSGEGAWPETTPPGEIPPQLAGLVGADVRFAREGYVLQWTRWNVVDSAVTRRPAPESIPGDAPPSEALVETVPLVGEIGAIMVHSRDRDLLGELLVRFGRETSFVRDTTWTLVLPQRPPR